MSIDTSFDIMAAGGKIRLMQGKVTNQRILARVNALDEHVEDLQRLQRQLDGGGLGDGHTTISVKFQELLAKTIEETKALQAEAGSSEPITDLLDHLTRLAAQINAEIGHGDNGPTPNDGPRPAVPASQKILEEPELLVDRDWTGNLQASRQLESSANESPVVGRDRAGSLIQERRPKSGSSPEVSRGVYYNKDGNLAMEE